MVPRIPNRRVALLGWSVWVALSGTVAAAPLAQPREWTAADGRKLSAAILGVERGDVVVALPGGQRRTLPFDQLSGEDQEWVENWEQARTVEAALPPPFWPRTVSQRRPAVETLEGGPGRSLFASEHFEFDCDGEVTPGLVQAFAQTAEATWRLVDALPLHLGDIRGRRERYRVRAFRTAEAFREAGAPPESAAFFAPEFDGHRNVLLVPFSTLGADPFLDRASRGSDFDNSVLVHEIANQITAEDTMFFPLWLRVGIGEYLARTPYSSGTFHLSLDQRSAEVRERVRLYEHIEPDASMLNPQRRVSSAWQWFVPLQEMMGGDASAAELLSRSLADRHRFYLTSMLMTTFFLNYEGDGDARRIRAYVERLVAASLSLRSGGSEGEFPLSLVGVRRPDPDDVREALRHFLTGEVGDVASLEEEMVAAYSKIGVNLRAR